MVVVSVCEGTGGGGHLNELRKIDRKEWGKKLTLILTVTKNPKPRIHENLGTTNYDPNREQGIKKEVFVSVIQTIYLSN